MRIGYSNLAGTGPARRRNLDRARTTNPGLAPLWRMARPDNECTRSLVRHGLPCARNRADTKPDADAGRQPLGHCVGRFSTIKTYASFQDHWTVRRGHPEPHLRNGCLSRSPGHSYATSRRRLICLAERLQITTPLFRLIRGAPAIRCDNDHPTIAIFARYTPDSLEAWTIPTTKSH
jgi:hypothetical protein